MTRSSFFILHRIGSWERLRFPCVVLSEKAGQAGLHHSQRVREEGITYMAKETIHDINATTDYAADKGKSEVEDLRRQVKDLTEKYGSVAQNTISDVKDKVQQNVGDIEKQIREKPVQATLVAAGVGFLVGALLSR
jgi:ElaB/YqjD/DUF883 family membrane-anchored ribosome-binding protein